MKCSEKKIDDYNIHFVLRIHFDTQAEQDKIEIREKSDSHQKNEK